MYMQGSAATRGDSTVLHGGLHGMACLCVVRSFTAHITACRNSKLSKLCWTVSSPGSEILPPPIVAAACALRMALNVPPETYVRIMAGRG
jgi:hypothetical protein